MADKEAPVSITLPDHMWTAIVGALRFRARDSRLDTNVALQLDDIARRVERAYKEARPPKPQVDEFGLPHDFDDF